MSFSYCKVEVRAVIVEEKEHFHDSPEFSWSDDEDVLVVENLLTLVQQKYPFKNGSFVGGATTLDVIKMREEEKTEANNRKKVKPKQTKQKATSDVIDFESVAAVVKEKMSGDFSRIERQITTLSETFLNFQNNVLDKFEILLRKIEDSNLRSGAPSSAQTQTCNNGHADFQQAEISRQTLHPAGTNTGFSENDIISEAIRFADQSTTSTIGVSLPLHLHIISLAG